MLKRNPYSKFNTFIITFSAQSRLILGKVYRYVKINLIAGLLILLPSVVTIMLLFMIFGYVDSGPFGKFIESLLGFRIPGLGLILTILFVVLCGVAARNIVGKQIFVYLDAILQKIPLAKHIIVPIKQLSEIFFAGNKMIFDRVVLVEYPRKGLYSIGFATSEAPDEINQVAGKKLTAVFVATTPNPTSGVMIMVPTDEINYLSMTPEDGMKLVISGGYLTPSQAGESQTLLKG